MISEQARLVIEILENYHAAAGAEAEAVGDEGRWHESVAKWLREKAAGVVETATAAEEWRAFETSAIELLGSFWRCWRRDTHTAPAWESAEMYRVGIGGAGRPHYHIGGGDTREEALANARRVMGGRTWQQYLEDHARSGADSKTPVLADAEPVERLNAHRLFQAWDVSVEGQPSSLGIYDGERSDVLQFLYARKPGMGAGDIELRPCLLQRITPALMVSVDAVMGEHAVVKRKMQQLGLIP